MPEDDREARFLAAQQARLSKNKQWRLRRNHDEEEQDDKADPSQQQQDDETIPCDQLLRRKFWILFKEECGNIRLLLDSFLSPMDPVSNIDKNENSNASIVENDENMSSAILLEAPIQIHQLSTLYVTAQQRNQAIIKIRDIQWRIRSIQQWTRYSSSVDHPDSFHVDPTTDMPALLDGVPHSLLAFIQKHDMVDLVSADVRLMEMDMQSLKDYAEKIEGMIQPKEKFSFRRYRAHCLEKSANVAWMDKGVESETSVVDVSMVKEETAVITPSTRFTVESSPPVDHHIQVLSERKYSRITVEKNGEIHEGILLDPMASTQIQNADSFHLEDMPTSSYIIRSIVNCHACLLGHYKSLHILDTHSSEIVITHPIAGPMHVTQCHGSFIFISSCHQLRIHDCSNVTFILHVTSGPIIENCTGIQFYQKDCQLSSLGPNMYGDVKDFNWLKKMKSPNFESFSQEFSTPRPFETIPIENNAVIVPEVQGNTSHVQAIEDDAEDIDKSYSSEDEL